MHKIWIDKHKILYVNKGVSMELVKSNIHMNKIVRKETTTFYVNRQCSVTEANPRLGDIIGQKETVTVDRVVIRNGQIYINGSVLASLLYTSQDCEMAWGIEEDIPFEETVRSTMIEDDCTADVQMMVMSSNVKIIDDRTYIYKVQLMAFITIEKLQDLETMWAEPQEGIMTRQRDLDLLSIVENKKDTLRIHDRISLPSNKQPIDRIVWKDVRIKNISTKVSEGMINVNGELCLFILYCPSESNRQQWAEASIPFNGTVDAIGGVEGMISYVCANLHNVSIEPAMDQDNVVRDLEIDAVLKLDIKLYQEEKVTVLEDVYKPGANLVPIMEEQCYEKLLVRNQARTPHSIKVKIPEEKGNVLQICNASAGMKVENIFVSENGIKVMGKIRVCVMYIPSEDSVPVCCQIKESDFEHKVDAEGITSDDKFYINWNMEQVSANMIGTNEIEVKSTVALETMAFKEEVGAFVSRIKEEPVDMEAMNCAPMLKGYVVQSGDTLWSLAKANYTTIEKIMEINNLDSDHIRKGDKLLIAKSCQ